MSVHAHLAEVSVRLGATQALDTVDLTVEPGQFMALLGPSGSGKTTTLNVLGGFVTPDSGAVTFDGSDVTRVPPSRRDIGIVFQGYALFPHMTVAQNVGFPLRMRKVGRQARAAAVGDALALVGLAELSDRSVKTLSGGQRQRVALARAMVFEPRMMLLDEPLAALDKRLRDAMQLELRRLQQRVGITTVAVTHDQVEALTMADLVAVMNDGRVEQVGTPEDVYLRPATPFVANFLGEANLVQVDRGHLPGFGQLPCTDSGQAVIRPEHLSLATAGARDATGLTAAAVVEDVRFQGSRHRVRVRMEGSPDVQLTLSATPTSDAEGIRPGDLVDLVLDPGNVHVTAARAGQNGAAVSSSSHA